SRMVTVRVGLFVSILAVGGRAWGHHPFDSEFDVNAPVRLSGTVTTVEWADPHVVIQLAVLDAGGQTRNWNFEGASPSVMEQKGWRRGTLKKGEQIKVQGYRAKSETFVAASRLIVLPDGKAMSAAGDA